MLFPYEMSGINGNLIKLNYASVLYSWKMLNKRAEILSTVRGALSSLAPTKQFEVGGEVWDCAICRLPVTNLGSFCVECMHGGHHQHLRAWFTSTVRGRLLRECPTGCGCVCADHMGSWDCIGLETIR